MAKFEDVKGKWRHRKTGKIVDVIGFPGGASEWLQLRHESGRVTKKALHYFMEEYVRVIPLAVRQAAHQERCVRAERLANVLEECGEGHRFIIQPEEEIIVLWYCGHKFTVTEVTE